VSSVSGVSGLLSLLSAVCCEWLRLCVWCECSEFVGGVECEAAWEGARMREGVGRSENVRIGVRTL